MLSFIVHSNKIYKLKMKVLTLLSNVWYLEQVLFLFTTVFKSSRKLQFCLLIQQCSCVVLESILQRGYVYSFFCWIRLLHKMIGSNYFLCPRDRRSGEGGIMFLSCLSLCHSLLNFSLANKFWTVSARTLIFHMNIPCDKTFPWVPLLFYPVTLTLLLTFEQRVLEVWYFTWVFLVIRPFFGY